MSTSALGGRILLYESISWRVRNNLIEVDEYKGAIDASCFLAAEWTIAPHHDDERILSMVAPPLDILTIIPNAGQPYDVGGCRAIIEGPAQISVRRKTTAMPATPQQVERPFGGAVKLFGYGPVSDFASNAPREYERPGKKCTLPGDIAILPPWAHRAGSSIRVGQLGITIALSPGEWIPADAVYAERVGNMAMIVLEK